MGHSRPPLVPSPPAMPVRIPSDQHETVVSVLREAARVNGDVEAYVEPDGRGGRREPDLRGVGPGGRRRGRPPRPPRGRQGRRRLPAPALVASTTPCSYGGAAPAGGHHLGHQPAHGSRRGGLHRRPGRAGPPGGRPRGGRPSRRRDGRGGHPRRGRGAGGTSRGPTAGRSWPRPTRSPWSGRAGRRAGPRAPSSITPTWPRWRGGPTC